MSSSWFCYDFPKIDRWTKNNQRWSWKVLFFLEILMYLWENWICRWFWMLNLIDITLVLSHNQLELESKGWWWFALDKPKLKIYKFGLQRFKHLYLTSHAWKFVDWYNLMSCISRKECNALLPHFGLNIDHESIFGHLTPNKVMWTVLNEKLNKHIKSLWLIRFQLFLTMLRSESWW
jgi:hypothetical protein